jgi:hypothetical protein
MTSESSHKDLGQDRTCIHHDDEMGAVAEPRPDNSRRGIYVRFNNQNNMNRV